MQILEIPYGGDHSRTLTLTCFHDKVPKLLLIDNTQWLVLLRVN